MTLDPFLFATVYALRCLFFAANYWSFGFRYSWSTLLFTILLMAPLVGWVWLHFLGTILHRTGKWLGGKAGLHEVRTLLAFSKRPHILFLPFWAFCMAFNPLGSFILGEGLPSPLLIYSFSFVLGFWSYILCIRSLSTVQGFSIQRSLANVIISWLIYSILFFILFCIFLIISAY